MENEPPAYTVKFSPFTQEFLDSLTSKEQAFIARQIQYLQQFGPALGLPHAKHIEGKVWELRIRCKRKIFRLFYTIDENRQANIHYGFHKTSDQIPKQIRKLALQTKK